MTPRRQLFNKISRWMLSVLGPHKIILAFWSNRHWTKTVNVRGVELVFDASEELHLWRAVTAATKEPETLDLIDSFEKGSVFYDVGANVGVYSLYAAKRGHCVYAFEPEAKNYAALHENIRLNHPRWGVVALNLALNDKTSLEYLGLHSDQSGDANHRLYDLRPGTCRQSVIAMKLDDCPRFLEPPHYLKIDTDGHERLVLAGGKTVLKSPTLKSVLIEMKGPMDPVRKVLEKAGMKLKSYHLAYRDEKGELGNGVFRR